MIMTGAAKNDADWAAYVKRAQDIGSEKLVAAYQGAYGRWLKTVK